MRQIKTEYLRCVVEQCPIVDLWSAEVIFGELVGNAIRHAGGEICISLHESSDNVVLGVRDRSSVLPQTPLHDGLDDHGRGLTLVNMLAPRVFVSVDSRVKEVLAELPK